MPSSGVLTFCASVARDPCVGGEHHGAKPDRFFLPCRCAGACRHRRRVRGSARRPACPEHRRSIKCENGGQREEIVSLRTEHAKFFPRGRRPVHGRVHAGPIHFNKKGSWLEIDPTLVPSTLPGFAWENRRGPLSLKFAATAGVLELVHASDGTSTLGFTLAGASPLSVGAVEGNRITYTDVQPNVDLVFEVRRQGNGRSQAALRGSARRLQGEWLTAFRRRRCPRARGPMSRSGSRRGARGELHVGEPLVDAIDGAAVRVFELEVEVVDRRQ